MRCLEMSLGWYGMWKKTSLFGLSNLSAVCYIFVCVVVCVGGIVEFVEGFVENFA